MNRLRLTVLLLATTAAVPAFAADIPAVSKVDSVTVFPSGAEVTRVATATIAAGEHALIFEGLPGDLMPETVRVEGDALGDVEIGSVDARLVPVPQADTDAQRKALEDRITALQDERAVLDQTIADAEYQKNLMQQLASGAFTAPVKEGEGKSFGAQDLGQLLDLVGGKLAALSKTVLDSRVRQRVIDEEVSGLNEQIAQLAPQDEERMLVTVHLAAPTAVSGTFRLRYRIAGASWQPVYDARLTSPADGKAAKIELVRRAAVTQSTTESWDNVALVLSTARPVGATAAPDLEAVLVDGRMQVVGASDAGSLAEAPPAPAAQSVEEALADKRDDNNELKAARKVKQTQAEVEIAGFQALYSIPGRVSVDNTGTAKNVRIGTEEIDAKLSARTVPKLDPTAYLTAAFALKGESPLLPGTAMLYRDGVFMGQGWLPLLSPGEETQLGFGADDLVKVKRQEVKRERGEEGLITSSNTDQRAYDITVKNLHGFALPVTVIDQMPYSVREDIVVETLPGMTPPTTKDFEKKRGVLAWDFTLEPKAEQVLKHGWKVTWPKDMDVGMNAD